MSTAARHRLFPAPLLSVMLFVTWLLLNQSLAAGHALLGALLALLIPMFSARLLPRWPRIKRPAVIAKLAVRLVADVAVANFEVARLILGPEARITPRFVWLPLSIRDPQGIVVLASIITLTPGTISAELSEDRRFLLLHAFNADDETALIARIKSRYEAALIEILQ